MYEKTKQYRMRLNQLIDSTQTWLGHWKDLSDYIAPRLGRNLTGQGTSQPNDGSKKNQKIINSVASDAVRVLSAGLMGGLVSPSRPWFNLTLPDEELLEDEEVKTWLHDSRTALLTVLAKSNFYAAAHAEFNEISVFGTGAMLIEEDFETVVRFRPFTIGEYYLGANSENRVDCLYRTFTMTAKQMIDEFGIDKVSEPVKTCYENDNLEERFDVVHCIQPSKTFDSKSKKSEDKPWESVYYEHSGSQDELLRKSGYDEQPFVAPRWETTGVDVLGSNCPGMQGIGDAKMLQKMEEKKIQALEKMVNPPLNAPTNMRNTAATLIPGGVNYVDVQQGQQGLTPVHQVNPDTQGIGMEIRNVEERIRRIFFNDLFLSILATDKNMTATEVAERTSERLLMLGPVVEKLQYEFLDKIIDRVFSIAERFGLIPEPPQVLEGMDVKVEYISLLAQAQKMVGTASIEQLAAFVGNLAAVKPDVLDKVNFDEMIDQYGQMLGAPPKVVRADEDVAGIRQKNMQAMQQQQMPEQLEKTANGAKTLSETEVGNNSALDQMLGALQ